jgi:glyoxylase-like metal-dependent hydrolase (beta-lactamase superfamily II)
MSRMMIVALAAVLSLVAAPNEITYTKISAHVAVLNLDLGEGWSSNMTVIESGGSLAIVDTFIDPVSTQAAKRLLEHYTDKPVTLLINTHFHRDHTGGNQVFAGATILGHRSTAAGMKLVEDRRLQRLEETRTKLEAALLKQSAELDRGSAEAHRLAQEIENLRREISLEDVVRTTPPGRTVGDRATLDLEGLTIEIRHFPRAHTNSDIAVFVPADGVIIAGDIVRNGVFPSLDPETGASLPSLIAAQEVLLAAGPKYTYVVPGNGPSGDLSIVQNQRDLLVELLGGVRQFKAEGKTLEQALAGIDLSPWKHLTWFAEGREALIRDYWGK